MISSILQERNGIEKTFCLDTNHNFSEMMHAMKCWLGEILAGIYFWVIGIFGFEK